MTNAQESTLWRLLSTCCAPQECAELLSTVRVAASIIEEDSVDVSRAVLAQTLNLLLFRDLLTRVPTGKRYVEECVSRGRQILFDHGALRTVALTGMGGLPAGERAITRLLIPLGYRLGAVYPLDRLGMTGRSYTHIDFAEELPQFFVSELHPERFSPAFQRTVALGYRVATSSTPTYPSHSCYHRHSCYYPLPIGPRLRGFLHVRLPQVPTRAITSRSRRSLSYANQNTLRRRSSLIKNGSQANRRIDNTSFVFRMTTTRGLSGLGLEGRIRCARRDP
jgi:hypothetical protein